MKILKPHLRIDEHFELILRKNLDESLETLRKCQRIKKKKKSVQIRRRPVINLQKFRLLWICWFKLNYVFTQLLTVDVLPVFFLTCLLCSCSVAERLAGVEAFDPLTLELSLTSHELLRSQAWNSHVTWCWDLIFFLYKVKATRCVSTN